MTLDPDTFLTRLYVLVDECCKARPAGARPGRPAALIRSEVVTLALFGQWGRFGSERDFYRYADQRLRGAFPRLPHRSQLNRRIRAEQQTLIAVGQTVAAQLGAATVTHEVLDTTAAPVRNAKRSGSGWLAGQAALGWSNRLGWYEGFHVLVAVTSDGVITGYDFTPSVTVTVPARRLRRVAPSSGTSTLLARLRPDRGDVLEGQDLPP